MCLLRSVALLRDTARDRNVRPGSARRALGLGPREKVSVLLTTYRLVSSVCVVLERFIPRIGRLAVKATILF